MTSLPATTRHRGRRIVNFSPLREGDDFVALTSIRLHDTRLTFQSPSRRGRTSLRRRSPSRARLIALISVPFAKGIDFVSIVGPRQMRCLHLHFSPLREGDDSRLHAVCSHDRASSDFSPLREGAITSHRFAELVRSGSASSFQSPSRRGLLRCNASNAAMVASSSFQSPSRRGRLRHADASPMALRQSISVPFAKGTTHSASQCELVQRSNFSPLREGDDFVAAACRIKTAFQSPSRWGAYVALVRASAADRHFSPLREGDDFVDVVSESIARQARFQSPSRRGLLTLPGCGVMGDDATSISVPFAKGTTSLPLHKLSENNYLTTPTRQYLQFR